MHGHRKGLNRALFWLYSGHGKWPSIFRWAMLVFDIVTIGLFLFHPVVSWRGVETKADVVWIAIDAKFGRLSIRSRMTTDVKE